MGEGGIQTPIFGPLNNLHFIVKSMNCTALNWTVNGTDYNILHGLVISVFEIIGKNIPLSKKGTDFSLH